MTTRPLAVLILVVLALVTVTPASADQIIEASGQTGITSVDSETCTPIGNSGHSLLTVTGTDFYTGTLNGSAVWTARIIALRPCGSTTLGSVTEVGRVVEHFTGTIASREGTAVIRWNFQIRPDSRVRNELVITQGTGELAGVRGTLKVDDVFCLTCTSSYSGQVHFAP